MNDFEGLLASDFGFKPQGKSAPMSASKPLNSSSSSSSNLNFDRDSIFTATAGSHKPHRSNDFSDIFAGPTRKSEANSFNFDSVFRESGSGVSSSTSGGPVFDKPVYDDDIFDGVPGLKSSSSKAKYEDVFASATVSSLSPKGRKNDAFDDLLGGFGKAEPQTKGFSVKKSHRESDSFDDLIPGFGGGGATAPTERPTSEASWSSEPTVSAAKITSNVMEDPFKVFESTSRPVVSSPDHFADPLEEISSLNNSGRTKSDGSSVGNGGVYDDIDPFDGLGKSVPAFSSDRSNRGQDKSPSRTDKSTSWSRTSTSKESIERTSVRSPESRSQKKMPVESDQESHQTLFDMPAFSADSHKSFGQATSPRSYVNSSSNESSVQVDISPTSEDNLESSDDVWLTVSEIPLFTQPTSAPPPSRPPPQRPVQVSKAAGSGSPAYANSNSRKKVNEHTSFPNSARQFQGPKSAPSASPFDDLEDFSMGRSQNNVDGHANGPSGEEFEMNSVAAAMKEAMDRAEAKFRHAKEVRERESTKSARSKDSVQLEKDEKTMQEERVLREEKQDRLDRERLHREREEEEREQKRLEKEREKEREQRRLEKEKERVREIERERARQAVERATREARERAANDARLRAEKVAVGKVNAEARERAERAAVQRAQAEARERAAADAKERAEKAAAEARERTNAESKERTAAAAQARARSERVAVERAAAEARERAVAEARERAAAAARMNQQKNENDLESFFSTGARPSSAPRPRTSSSNKQEPEVAKKSTTNSSNIRKANSTTNIVDDLSSIFGAAPSSSSGDFQDVEGESEDRRRARLERHQRTQERAAKALAEKNQRDLQTQRDQAERHRIAETLDVEIKRWAAGKEGNLRALLSTLQYVLWPESGWQPVSLTDLINAAAVKKVYRKATLCIHPDKVQQKGANLQQKYVAEKVFDLLKEAWNKFNSEELF